MGKLKAVLIAALMAVVCGKGPVDPGPVPTPSPLGTPVPQPVRPLPELGEPAIGAVVCCSSGGLVDEGLRDGWPLITEEAAERFRQAGVRVTHLRTDPADPRTISELGRTVQMLKAKGIRAEVTLIDGWLLRHTRPFGDNCKVTNGPPQERHVEWIQRVVAAAGPDAWYDVGNEIGLCRPDRWWYKGVAEAARAAGARVVGGDQDHGFLDYLNYHGFHIKLENSHGQSVHLNESDNEDYTPDQWESLIRKGLAAQVLVFYWPGPNDDAERAEVLRRVKTLAP